MLFTAVGFGVVVAFRNLRSGRGDRRGAARVWGIIFLGGMVIWLLSAEHVVHGWELRLLTSAVMQYLLAATVNAALYLAIEPYVRRRWPDSLISWTRLLSGRFRDSLIASHILAGFLLFTVTSLMINTANIFAAVPPQMEQVFTMNSAASFSAGLLNRAASSLLIATTWLLLTVLFRVILRRMWIADVVGCIAIALLAGVDYNSPYAFAITAGTTSISIYSVFWLLRRFGFLAAVSFWLLMNVLFIPITFTGWYAGRSMVILAIPVAIAAWALWVIVSSQRVTSTTSPT